MHLPKKLLLPAVPLFGLLALASPAGAATASHQRAPVRLAPHFTPAMRAPAAGPSVVTGTQENTYVSTTGTDSPLSMCPQSAPCATITYAESQTASGGTIHVAAGTYNQTANLTQPVNLVGAGEKKVIIEGTNIDEGAMGYYGVIGIDNTSGIAGTIAVSGMTVKDAYVTANEYTNDQEPIDICNEDSQAGDTVDVTHVEVGPVQDSSSYAGVGYYSLDAVSTNNVEMDYATGLYNAFFSEGSGGPTKFREGRLVQARRLDGYEHHAEHLLPGRGDLGLGRHEREPDRHGQQRLVLRLQRVGHHRRGRLFRRELLG